MFIKRHSRRLAGLTSITITKIVLTAVPFVVLIWLADQNFALSSRLTYTYRPGRVAHVIGPKNPSAIIATADHDLRWRITNDVLPFVIHFPRLLSSLTINLALQPGNQSLVTLDVPGAHGETWTSIVLARALDQLPWPKQTDGKLTIWTRDQGHTTDATQAGKVTASTPAGQVVGSIAELLDANVPSDRIAVAGMNAYSFTHLSDYQPSSSAVIFNHALRGSHQLYVYADHETVSLSFTKTDLNREIGGDPMTIRLGQAMALRDDQQTWLKTLTVPDDGNATANGRHGSAQSVHLEYPVTDPGVYIFDIQASGDSVLSNISTLQHVAAFSRQLYLADGPAYGITPLSPMTARLNGSEVSFAAYHDQGKQDLIVGNKHYPVADLKVDHVVSGLSGITGLNLSKGDGVLSSDGLIGFSGWDMLPAGAQVLDLSSEQLPLHGVRYVVAPYRPHSQGPVQFSATYPFSDVAYLGKTITVNLQAPGLQTRGTSLGLRQAQVTFARGPFPWKKAFAKIGLR